MNVKELIEKLRAAKMSADARTVVEIILDYEEKEEKEKISQHLPTVMWEVVLHATDKVIDERVYRVLARTEGEAIEKCGEIDPISVEELDREGQDVAVAMAGRVPEPAEIKKTKGRSSKRKGNNV